MMNSEIKQLNNTWNLVRLVVLLFCPSLINRLADELSVLGKG